MCGGLFGDTGRGAETPAAKALRLEKQARDAAAEKEKMARQVEEMQRANAAAADTTEMAKRAVQQLSATKEEAERAAAQARDSERARRRENSPRKHPGSPEVYTPTANQEPKVFSIPLLQ